MRQGKYLISALLCLATVAGFQHPPVRVLSIPQFKQMLHKLNEGDDFATGVFSVSGYYYYAFDRRPEKRLRLITDTNFMRRNSLIPDSVYIWLIGKGIDSISELSSNYQDSYVKVKFGIENKQPIVLERPVILRRANGN
jgi:hypothetical protein